MAARPPPLRRKTAMDESGRSRFIMVLNIVGFLGTVVVNTLAVTLPLNNKTTGELSDLYPNLFVPAGLTFSIWGVIYALLGVFAAYHVVSLAKKDAEGLEAFDRVGYLFFASSVLNMAWIFAWHYELVGISLLVMLLLLGSLITAYFRLGIGRTQVPRRIRYLVNLPFSVYLGWITVATIANVTAFLVDLNWGRFGLSEQLWTVGLIAVAIAIALAVLVNRADIYYCLVVDWALLGILVKRQADPDPFWSIIAAAIAGMVLISAAIVLRLIKRDTYSGAVP
jgi:hypothetical protein